MTARYPTWTQAIPCHIDCGNDKRDSDSDNDTSSDGGSQTTKPDAMNYDAHRANHTRTALVLGVGHPRTFPRAA